MGSVEHMQRHMRFWLNEQKEKLPYRKPTVSVQRTGCPATAVF